MISDPEIQSERIRKAASDLQKSLAPTKAAFEKPAEPPKKDKGVRRRSKKGSLRMSVGANKLQKSSTIEEEATMIDLSQQTTEKENESGDADLGDAVNNISAPLKSDNQEESDGREENLSDPLIIKIVGEEETDTGIEDEDDMGEDEEEEDDEDGNEIRPVRPIDAKPSKENNPRKLSFMDSKLSMWEYLGYSYKPNDGEISAVHV